MRDKVHDTTFFILVALVAFATSALVHCQFTSSTPRAKDILLEGHWQSCREDDGTYAERVYDHLQKPRFELHMGPRDEFALFAGVQEEHRDHNLALNLLKPSYHAEDVETWRGARTWTATIEHVKLWFNVVQAGGSRDECESYYVILRTQ